MKGSEGFELPDTDTNEKYPTLIDQRGMYPQGARTQNRTGILQNLRHNKLNQQDQEQFIASVNQQYQDNIRQMTNPVEVTESNINEYYQSAYNNISEEDLQAVVKIRADWLAAIWTDVLKELQKLSESLSNLLSQLNSVPTNTEEIEKISALATPIRLIHTYKNGIQTNLNNLTVDDHDKRSLALVSASARKELLVDLLNELSKKNFGINIKPLKILTDKIDSVLRTYSNL